MPFERSHPLKRLLSYALSATTSSVRCFGPPLPRRGTRTVSSVPTASFTSWWFALANPKPIGRPFPSAASISLVPLPRLVFPTASPFFGRDETALEGNSIPVEILALAQQPTPDLFQVPSPYHALSLRQHVLGGPYSRGTSSH